MISFRCDLFNMTVDWRLGSHCWHWREGEPLSVGAWCGTSGLPQVLPLEGISADLTEWVALNTRCCAEEKPNYMLGSPRLQLVSITLTCHILTQMAVFLSRGQAGGPAQCWPWNLQNSVKQIFCFLFNVFSFKYFVIVTKKRQVQVHHILMCGFK